VPICSKKVLFEEDMNVQNFKTIKASILGFSFGNFGKKCHLDVAFMESHTIYYKEGSGVSSQRLWVM
jgi:hypothetical protein